MMTSTSSWRSVRIGEVIGSVLPKASPDHRLQLAPDRVEARRAQLRHEHHVQPLDGVDEEGGREHPAPIIFALRSGHHRAGNVLRHGKAQAEAGAGILRLAEKRPRQAAKVLAARQVVHRHQLERLAADDPRTVQRPAILAHPAEAVIIERGRHEATAAGQQLRLSAPRARLAAIVHHASLALDQCIAVGQPVGLVLRHRKESVVHAQRAEDARGEELVERYPRHALHHCAEHIGRDGVIPRRSRREFQRQLAQRRDEAVEVVVAVPTLQLRFAMRGVDVRPILETIGQPGRMAQQIEHTHRLGSRFGDERHATTAAVIDADTFELRQDVVDRRIDRDLTLLDQHHEGEAGDRLGHRRDAEERTFVDI
ncbi:hypothetical protein WR25_22670 [Diploscapter pachys]|uniref:Uncharacterized protein n=1 Tax=Diploscapter pachys TaxID=2018661 RepID=A0A2A2JYG4_9BILA|nr:hypothetical protein WR25_22670 [Diploscapter pachys]